MAFVQAMNTPTTTKTGVNGAEVYTEEGVGDYRLTLFTMLNRGLSIDYIESSVNAIFNKGIHDELRDLFVMAFQTRDIRGGKGEKRLFYDFFSVLYKKDAITAEKMVHLIPEYGCWRDLWELMKLIPEIETSAFKLVRETFKDDLVKCHSSLESKMSLLAKWIPREGSGRYPGLARKLADFIYDFNGSSMKRMVQYRKDVSLMNKALKTVEINMCNSTWADIKPKTVPGQCLKLHTKAFLNKPFKSSSSSDELRYPNNPDRMKCREHFQEFVEALKNGTQKAHGANVVMPHELVKSCLHYDTSQDERDIIQGQWESIREETLKFGRLGKCVPMCDFSGSMDGVPKLVSFALGILISEINHISFKNHILSFDSTPSWYKFSNNDSLYNKVKSVPSALGQGLSTNFYKACMRILDKMVEHRVPVGEEPEDLIVLTDMGYDNAVSLSSGAWPTQLNDIRNMFKLNGEKIWGEGNGWKPPRIVIWNLRAEYKDFHATSEQDGVVQLSGWSPSILKVLQQQGIIVSTPFQGMRVTLDDERYDEIRHIWDLTNSRT